MNIAKIRNYVNDPSGLDCLGSGSFGSAYRLPDGRALKLGESVDGTALWVMHAAKALRETGKAPMYAPEVYAFEVLESGRWWAIMEWVTSEKKRTGNDSWDCPAPTAMRAALIAWGDSLELDMHEGDYSYPDCHGGNWGTTKAGRKVCFDPFAGEQPHSTFDVHPLPPKMKHRAVQGRGPNLGRWARG